MEKLKNCLKGIGALSVFAFCMFAITCVALWGKFSFENWVKDKVMEKVNQNVENGAVIYLDGNEVELQNIDIFQYHMEEKDGNIILSSK